MPVAPTRRHARRLADSAGSHSGVSPCYQRLGGKAPGAAWRERGKPWPLHWVRKDNPVTSL